MTHPALTWGQLRDWAEENEVPDDAVLQDQRGDRIRDLAHYDEGPGDHTLVLQSKWG